MKRRYSQQIKKTERAPQPRRERDPIPWRYCFLTLICGVLLVGGFFLAARQHFSAIDYGIKNAKLRREKETLEAEQQRLKLAREVTLSPPEIKKAARKIGLREMTASNIEVYGGGGSNATKDSPPKTSADKPNQNSSAKTQEARKANEAKSETKNEKKSPASAAAATTATAKNDSRKSESKADKKGEKAR
jgi:hypothetical protein